MGSFTLSRASSISTRFSDDDDANSPRPGSSRSSLLSTDSSTEPVDFDPTGSAETLDELSVCCHKALEQSRKIWSNNQTDVVVCACPQYGGDLRIVKGVKRSNPSRDKYELLRMNRQGNNQTPGKRFIHSTEQAILREVAILKTCRHGQHVRYSHMVNDKNQERVYIALEYCRGGAVQWQDEQNNPLLTVEQARRIFRDAICGIEYLHYMGIIHRDIKPANLVWSGDRSHVKIIDYGISHFDPTLAKVPTSRRKEHLKPLLESNLFPPEDLKKLRGTDYFLAPEVVRIDEAEEDSTSMDSAQSSRPPSQLEATSAELPPEITESIDVWALGITLYCLLFGHVPFDIDQTCHPVHARFKLFRDIRLNNWDVDEFMGADRASTARRDDPTSVLGLLDGMLQKHPLKRTSLDKVKRHPWVLEGIPDPKSWLRQTSPSQYYVSRPVRWLQVLFDRIRTLPGFWIRRRG